MGERVGALAELREQFAKYLRLYTTLSVRIGDSRALLATISYAIFFTRNRVTNIDLIHR
jgi:hypothetical protein